MRVGEERGESLWWNDLKKVCGGGGSLNWFDEGMSWEIGEGDQCRFWKDESLGGKCLADLFPRLYLI